MEILTLIVFGVFCFVSALIIPWVNRSQISQLNKETSYLKTIIKELLGILEKEGIVIPEKLKTKQSNYSVSGQDHVTTKAPETQKFLEKEIIEQSDEPFVSSVTEAVEEKIQDELQDKMSSVSQLTIEQEFEQVQTQIQAQELEQEQVQAQEQVQEQEQVEKTSQPVDGSSLEQLFGSRVLVWLGGIALALAGLFLVKYSIENNFFSPTRRVVLSGFLGLALLYAGHFVRRKPDFANGVRIAQALSGAGIAVFYAVFFAAASLYHLIPNFLGFLGMCAVTLTAIILSLRHGAPIALLGLVGGFLTPALVGSNEPSAPLLFLYLYILFSGSIFVIQRNSWWNLSIPTLVATFAWVLIWVNTQFLATDTIWLGLFLMAISANIVMSSRLFYQEESREAGLFTTEKGSFKFVSMLNIMGIGGATLLMGILVNQASFGLFPWFLFGIFTIGGIGLAYFNDKLYGFVPLVSVFVSALLFFTWETPEVQIFALILSLFAIMHIGAGYFLMWRSEEQSRQVVLWAGLVAASSLVFYLLAYFKLRHTGFADFIPLFWGLAALVFAGMAVCVLQKIRTQYQDCPCKDYLLAIFASTVATFISLGFSIELGREFLPVAFAMEMFALSWINRRIPIKALPWICMVLGTIFGVLLIPQAHLLVLLQLSINNFGGIQHILLGDIFVVQYPLFQLGLPALLCFGTSYFLRFEKDGRFVRSLELTAVSLVTVMGYYLTRYAFHQGADILYAQAGFFERGIITNILCVFGLVCFMIGRRFDRITFSWSGIGLCVLALFRIIYFDLLILNPLVVSQKIEGWFIFNSLLLPYGLTLLWAWFISNELFLLKKEKWGQYIRGFSFFLLFVLINLNVRYFFHGEYLNGGITSNGEVYSYSVAWLLFGVGLLLAGIFKQNRMLRYASLGIMLLTAAKVFLYDASELEGLFRVFSFFGLGFSLLGLSWFYTRFVFGNRDEK